MKHILLTSTLFLAPALFVQGRTVSGTVVSSTDSTAVAGAYFQDRTEEFEQFG